MNHFLAIDDLSPDKVRHLLERAFSFKFNQDYPTYTHHIVANLFYENSTRTRISFELAAKHLSMGVVNVDVARSSENKGELIDDTIRTLSAMGIHWFVIRHVQDGLPADLAKDLGTDNHIINAGDGQHAHPSQAMLDLMTITEKKPDLESLKIAIVGDIAHSRVANSLQCLFKIMGVRELCLVAPSLWQPKIVHYGRVTNSLEDGLQNADVVIGLRVQKERLAGHETLDLAYYREHYALTEHSISIAKPDLMILHPGPINRGVEIDNAVADGPHSSILTQVQNGIYMRMAILDALASGAW